MPCGGRNHAGIGTAAGAERRRARGGARGGFRADAGRPRRPGADGAICAAVDPARDFEAAAATLERLIDLEPANATARLELATAYFAMGNYPLAEYHLNAAAASGALSPEQLASAEAYRGAAAERDAPSRFSGSVAAGIVSADGEIGVLGTGALTWSLDLGDANATQWVTQIGLSTYQLDADPGASTADRLSFRVRTGPQFQLTGEAFGPRLQPYVELRVGPLSRRRDLGLRRVLRRPRLPERPQRRLDQLRRRLHRLGRAGRHRRRYRFPRRLARCDLPPLAGGVLSPDPVDGQRGHRHAHEDQHGLRFDYGRDFDGPAALSGPDWRAGAFASVDWLDITDTGVARDETVTAAGLSLRAYLNDDIYVETRGTHLTRDGGTNADETVFSMQLGLEF
jgi:hypothetical protein